MPMSKLTLSADKELIEQAKRLAEENNTSVSAMFARLLVAMTRRKSRKDIPGPITRKATGLIRLPKRRDDRLLEDALAERYGFRS